LGSPRDTRPPAWIAVTLAIERPGERPLRLKGAPIRTADSDQSWSRLAQGQMAFLINEAKRRLKA
jgi:hypothetical protein